MTERNKTMTKTATIPTRQQVEQQAAELAAQVDAFREQDQQQAAEDQQRKVEAQRVFDEQLVGGYSSDADEAEVRQARDTLEAALRDNPLVRAFADYTTSLRQVSHRQYEASAALTRLGRPSFRPSPVVSQLVGGLDEYVLRAVDAIADERVDAARADLHARRDAAGDNPKENR